MFLAKLFLFLSFIPVYLIFAQENTFTDLDNRRIGIVITASTSFRSAVCPESSKMLSYDGIQRIREINLNLTDSFWINSSAEYSPWMYYRGINSIKEEQIQISKQLLENGNQLSICVNFCNDYWTIGLQVDKCACLLNGDIFNRPTFNVLVTACKEKQIAKCAGKNTENIMAIYQKEIAPNIINGLGECLSVKRNETSIISYVPKRCDSRSDVQIIQGQAFRSGPTNVSWMVAEKYTVDYSFHFPTLQDLKTKTLREAEFWLANFREHIFSNTAPNFNNLLSLCVSGRTVNGKIELYPANCTEHMPTVCIKEYNENIGTRNMSDATITTDRGKTENEHDTSKDFVTAVVVCSIVLIVIIAALSVFIIRILQRRKANSAHEPVYAVVEKNKNRQESHNHTLNRLSNQNVNMPLTGEESEYDHTNFTNRSHIEQVDACNYDTMENIEVTGEYLYHQTMTSQASAEGDESVYHHATYFQQTTQNDENK